MIDREQEGSVARKAKDDGSTPTPTSGSAPSKDLRRNLRRQLRGDLDTILLKALAKEPQRRYVSVEQFATDIGRHMAGLPVAAVPSSVAYRATKFVRRNRVGVLAAAFVTVAILIGVASTIREARIASANRQKAEQRFNDVRKLANSLMFEIHDSIQDLPGSTPARKLLVSRAIEYLDSLARDAAGDRSLQSELAAAYERVGRVQGGDFGRANLGDAQGAYSSFRKMLEIRQSIAAANPQDIAVQTAVARSYRAIADLQAVYLADLPSALQNCKNAIAITEPLSKGNSSDNRVIEELAADYDKLGDIQGGGNGSSANLGDYPAAVENHIRSQVLVKSLASQAPSNRRLERWLGVADYKLQNDLNQAEELDSAIAHAKEAAEIFKRRADETNNTLSQHDVGAGYDALAVLSSRVGRFADALSYYRQEVIALEPGVAADPKNLEYASDLIVARAHLGHSLCKTGSCDEGVALQLSQLGAMSKIDPDGKSAQTQANLAEIENELGQSLASNGNLSNALEHYAHSKSIFQRLSVEQPTDVSNRLMLASVQNLIADAYARQGSTPKAENEYRSSLAISEALVSSSSNLQAVYAAFKGNAGLGDVSVILAREAASTGERATYRKQARAYYERSLTVVKRLPHKSPVDPNGFDSPDPVQVASRLASLDATMDRQRIEGGRKPD